MKTERRKCSFIIFRLMDTPNRNSYQKPLAICTTCDTQILAVEREGKVSKVDQAANTVAFLSFGRKFWPILFPLWTFYKIFRYQGLNGIIYTDWHSPSLFVGTICRLLGMIWIADIWDNPDKRMLNWLDSKRKPPFWKYLYHKIQSYLNYIYFKFPNKVVTSQPDVVKVFGVSDQKIVAHPNGVDLSKTVPDTSYQSIRSNIKLLYVGPIERNRLRYLSDILKNTYNRIGNFDICLIGKTDQSNFLDELKRSIPKEITYRVTGWIDHNEVLEHIRSSTVCLFPYPRTKEINEIFPIKIFEYLAMNKVVVASKTKVTQQIITHKKNGFLYEAQDTEKVAAYIDEIVNDPCKKLMMEREAGKTALEYSWEKIISDIMSQLEAYFSEKSDDGIY